MKTAQQKSQKRLTDLLPNIDELNKLTFNEFKTPASSLSRDFTIYKGYLNLTELIATTLGHKYTTKNRLKVKGYGYSPAHSIKEELKKLFQ